MKENVHTFVSYQCNKVRLTYIKGTYNLIQIQFFTIQSLDKACVAS